MRRWIAHWVGGLVRRSPRLRQSLYRLRYGPFGRYAAHAFSVPSWLERQEGLALASACHALPSNAVVIEVGSFLGGSTILLAGARKERGSGKVHCVDPFDASGDDFSVSSYRAIAETDARPLRDRFEANIAAAGVSDWVEVHTGTAASVAAGWTEPIDMLFLDGDQSPDGARLAYDSWVRFLKIGGVIALHNSNDRAYAPGHEGYRLLAAHIVRPPHYGDVRCVETTTFARRLL